MALQKWFALIRGGICNTVILWCMPRRQMTTSKMASDVVGRIRRTVSEANPADLAPVLRSTELDTGSGVSAPHGVTTEILDARSLTDKQGELVQSVQTFHEEQRGHNTSVANWANRVSSAIDSISTTMSLVLEPSLDRWGLYRGYLWWWDYILMQIGFHNQLVHIWQFVCEVSLQEISNRTLWTDPSTWVVNSSSNWLRVRLMIIELCCLKDWGRRWHPWSLTCSPPQVTFPKEK